MKPVRAKVQCQSITETKHYRDNKSVFTAKFYPVVSGSDENEKFFDATPSGSIELGTFKEDHFEVGKEYYLDFTLAE